jgi:hypothetical protein
VFSPPYVSRAVIQFVPWPAYSMCQFQTHFAARSNAAGLAGHAKTPIRIALVLIPTNLQPCVHHITHSLLYARDRGCTSRYSRILNLEVPSSSRCMSWGIGFGCRFFSERAFVYVAAGASTVQGADQRRHEAHWAGPIGFLRLHLCR